VLENENNLSLSYLYHLEYILNRVFHDL